MKLVKWKWVWKSKKLPKNRTFLDWLFRRPQVFFDSQQLFYVSEPIEFDSLTKLLEDSASTQTKGSSCHCLLTDGTFGFTFSVDKGRNKIAIQCSGMNHKAAKQHGKILKGLLETDVNGMLFDIADPKTGKTYEVVFNIVNRALHAAHNQMIESGG